MTDAHYRDTRFTVKLPDSIDFPKAACLMCAGMSIYGAVKRAEVPSGGSVAIVGIGGLGHIGTQLAKAMVSTYMAEMEVSELQREIYG